MFEGDFSIDDSRQLRELINPFIKSGVSLEICDLGDEILGKVNDLIYTPRISDIQNIVNLYDQNGNLIGSISPSCFEKHSDHLYKKIEEGYRGKGYGTALLYEYIKAGFKLPEFEYTQDKATIALLMKFGYTVQQAILSDSSDTELEPIRICHVSEAIEYIEKGYYIQLSLSVGK